MKIAKFNSNLLAKQAFAAVMELPSGQIGAPQIEIIEKAFYTLALSFKDTVKPAAAAVAGAEYLIANIANLGDKKAKPEHLIGAFIVACSLGVMFDKTSQNAYMVVYKGVAQLQLGYRFYIAMARRQISSLMVTMEIVTNDELPMFSVEEKGDRVQLFHTMRGSRNFSEPNMIAAVYAKIMIGGRVVKIHVMPRFEMERIKAMSKSLGSMHSPWNAHPIAMWQAKCVRQAFKLLGIVDDPRASASNIDDDSVEVEEVEGDYEAAAISFYDSQINEYVNQVGAAYTREACAEIYKAAFVKLGFSKDTTPKILLSALEKQTAIIAGLAKLSEEERAQKIAALEEARLKEEEV